MPTVLGDRKDCVMARSSRRRRDVNGIANRRLPVSHQSTTRLRTDRRKDPDVSHQRYSYMTEIEDRRRWHPEGAWRPARSFNQSRHRLTHSDDLPQPENRNKQRLSPSPNYMARYSEQVPVGIGFQEPDKVLICVRRNMRREVLHALKKTGKSGGQKTPRFNEYSKIFCRRK